MTMSKWAHIVISAITIHKVLTYNLYTLHSVVLYMERGSTGGGIKCGVGSVLFRS
jgi:hypothetical protein